MVTNVKTPFCFETPGPCESARKCSADKVTDDTSARVENVTALHTMTLHCSCPSGCALVSSVSSTCTSTLTPVVPSALFRHLHRNIYLNQAWDNACLRTPCGDTLAAETEKNHVSSHTPAHSQMTVQWWQHVVFRSRVAHLCCVSIRDDATPLASPSSIEPTQSEPQPHALSWDALSAVRVLVRPLQVEMQSSSPCLTWA